MRTVTTLACLAVCFVLPGCDIPAPAMYDDAMLQEFFGKSPQDVREAFGEPKTIDDLETASPPRNATEGEKQRLAETTDAMRYVYSTPDGDLVFHFNLNDVVRAITYAGRTVPAPEAGDHKPL